VVQQKAQSELIMSRGSLHEAANDDERLRMSRGSSFHILKLLLYIVEETSTADDVGNCAR